MINIQLLPWVLSMAVLLVVSLFFIFRSVSYSRSVSVLNERLSAREMELVRIGEERDRDVASLSIERDRERELYENLNREHIKLNSDYAALKATLEEEKISSSEKIALLEQSEARLSKEFEILAGRIFEEKEKKFGEASRTGIEFMLAPVREQLLEFRKKVEDVYDRESRDRASLRTEIQSLKTLNERIGTDALNLTMALKGDSKVRGTWGEIQLERVLEEAGLVKGREFEIQTAYRNVDGGRHIPDVVVHLPDKKDVIIDSKVSLVAYEQYFASESDEDRKRFLKDHLSSVRSHVSSLSGKNYDELKGLNSLDIVIMFVPVEPALLLAFEHDSGLFSEAFKMRILIVSPATLMPTIRIIHNIWRYEYQNANARAIAAEAGKLHDQFVLFVESLEKVGEQIRKAGEIWEQAHKRLVSGRGNIVGRAHKLKTMGAGTKKELPQDMLEEAEQDTEPLT